MSDPGYAIPIIDFAALRRATEGGQEAIAQEVEHAFSNVGFCYLANHGVSDVVIAEARAAALEFFHLPLDEKMKVKPKESVRGFNHIGKTTMYGAEQPDHKEYYQMGLHLPDDDPAVLAGQPLRGPNQWPQGLPRFEPAMTGYFNAIALCGRRFLRVVARSLGADPDFFADKYDKPLQRTQAVWYPPHPPAVEGELFGVAPHTDYGCVTLLWQDEVGGLEVQDRSGAWVQAPPIPGTLVINIGDLLARWSNDRYRSTLHRVTNRSGRERLSIATFYDPDFTAPVDPAALGLAEAATRRYDPTTAGDYIMGRINASQKGPQPASRT